MKLLLVDCNNIGHRARHSTGDLSHNGEPTGVIFGFLRQLYTITKTVRPTHFVFAWDSPRWESSRKKIYPEYKANREKDKAALKELEPVFAQFEILQHEVLPNLGFKNIFKFKGYEADDIIAAASKNITAKDTAIIISTDEDMYQLLAPNVMIYNPYKKASLDEKGFKEAMGISPAQWIQVKAIAGCKSDNVQGVVGVGEKTAIAYIIGNCKPSKKIKDIITWKYNSKNRLSKEYRTNKKLVTIPFKGFPENEITIHQHAFSSYAFKQICKRFGFGIWTNDLDWETYFG